MDTVGLHAISLADAPAKAAELAKFVAKPADKLRRVALALIDSLVDSKADMRIDRTDGPPVSG